MFSAVVSHFFLTWASSSIDIAVCTIHWRYFLVELRRARRMNQHGTRILSMCIRVVRGDDGNIYFFVSLVQFLASNGGEKSNFSITARFHWACLSRVHDQFGFFGFWIFPLLRLVGRGRLFTPKSNYCENRDRFIIEPVTTVERKYFDGLQSHLRRFNCRKNRVIKCFRRFPSNNKRKVFLISLSRWRKTETSFAVASDGDSKWRVEAILKRKILQDVCCQHIEDGEVQRHTTSET